MSEIDPVVVLPVIPPQKTHKTPLGGERGERAGKNPKVKEERRRGCLDVVDVRMSGCQDVRMSGCVDV